MAVTSAMRSPSVASGLYPERRDEPESAPEHALQQLRGLWLRRSGARPAALAEMVSLVDAKAAGLAVASKAALAARISSLRTELSTDGLRDSLLAQTFALVREVAGRTLGTRHYDVQLQATRLGKCPPLSLCIANGGGVKQPSWFGEPSPKPSPWSGD